MRFLFEKDGHKFFTFPKNTNLPIERFAEMMALQDLLGAGLSGEEMEKILGLMEQVIAAGITNNPKNVAILNNLIYIMRQRKDGIIHRDLLLNIAAIWIVRDDEPIQSISVDIHNEKLTLFERMSKEDSHGFFTALELPILVPLLSMSPQDFKELWENNGRQMKILTEQLAYLSSNLQVSSENKRNRSKIS
jgi:hypothetical protein